MRFKILCLPALLLLAGISQASVVGSYDYFSRSDLVTSQENGRTIYTPPNKQNYAHVFGREYNKRSKRFEFNTIYFCKDTTSRHVPGKLVDGYCFVEHNGKEWKNSDFYLLKVDSTPVSGTIQGTNNAQNYGFTMLELNSSSTLNARSHGITGGGVEAGDATYHCVIYRSKDNSNETFLGKYVPGDDSCYYGWFGARKVNFSESGFKLYVPVADSY